jgi:hypothetical protein
MQQHKYHRFFLPILFKLYKEKQNSSFIDITECLTGTDDQNDVILYHLELSEFAIIQDDSTFDLLDSRYNTKKFSAKIQPLGIDYVENFIEEYEKANKKNPPIGFKTNT